MRKEKNNNRIPPDDFVRYRKGRMSGRERNAFEKKLQRDHFAEEAAEGYEDIHPDAMAEDLSILRSRLKKRISSGNRRLYLRIAASVVILLAVSSVFYIVVKVRNHDRQLALATEETYGRKSEGKKSDSSLVVPLQEAPLIRHETVKEAHDKDAVIISRPHEEEKETSKISPPVPATAGAARAVINVSPAAGNELKMDKAEMKRARSSAGKEETFIAEGRVTSSEDNSGIPGASVAVKGTACGTVTDANGNFSISLPDSSGHTLVASYIGMETKEFSVKSDQPATVSLDPSTGALAEVVVTGYGISREKSVPEEDDRPYVFPRPSGGKKQFDSYIRENLRNPDSTLPGTRAVVVLSFIVRANGAIDSVEVVKSPAGKYSDEAMRILKEGPSWLPAEDNGKAVDDRVKLRIVFR